MSYLLIFFSFVVFSKKTTDIAVSLWYETFAEIQSFHKVELIVQIRENVDLPQTSFLTLTERFTTM